MKSILLCLTALLAVGALMASAAAAVEIEAPAWNTNANKAEVEATRLEAEQKRKATSKNPGGTEVILYGELENSETKKVEKIEIRCKKVEITNQELNGSKKEHDGTQEGTIVFKECRLFAGGVEQTGCEVPEIKSEPLKGRLWLEGKKSEGGKKIVIAFEPKEGKVIAKAVINQVTGKKCAFTGTYNLEGSFAANLPNEKEGAILRYVFPATPILHVYQPPAQEAEAELGLKLGGNPARIEGEIENELTTKEKFRGFAPLGAFKVAGAAIGGPVKYEAAMNFGRLESSIEKTGVIINCTDAPIAAGNILGNAGNLTGSDELKACVTAIINKGKREILEGCTIKPVGAAYNGQIVGEGELELTGSGPEEAFTEIKVENNGKGCAVTGTFKLKGTELCIIPEAEIEAETHEAACAPGGSNMKLGAEKAKLTKTETVKVEKGQLWSSN